MYELFTLGGGTYLVDLLNAVAAITSGGAYVTLAQLAGVGGLGWVLFRTAFGGSWKDNAKWMLLFVTVWGAMIVPKGDRAGGRPARSGARARRRGQRAHRARAVRLADQPGRRRADAAHRTGLHPAGRSRLPAPRPDIRGQARRRDDAPGDHRHGVRAERAQLCQAVRVLRPAARPHLGRRSEGKHGYLVPGHRRGHAVRRRLARAHVRVRHKAGGGRHRGDADRPRDRHLPGRRGAAECAVERGDRPRRHDLRDAASSRARAPRRWPAPNCSRPCRPPTTFSSGASRSARARSCASRWC